jgi:hypothetical protein
MHGGGTPQARAKAKARRAEEDAAKALARLDVPPVADPLTALAQLAGQAIAFKDILAARVNELRQIRYRDSKGAEQLRSEVALWERALDRCERFVSAMARLNIDERLAQIEERQVDIVANAISATLTDLGLPEETLREARRGIVRHLRIVTR